MQKEISSTQNPLIKQVALLHQKSRERRKRGLFIIEGLREIFMALKGGIQIETFLFYPEIISESEKKEVEVQSSHSEWIAVSQEVYQKLTYRSGTEGIIAIAKSVTKPLDSLDLNSENPLLLIAEAPEKPGNIGALLRTADAAHLDAVIIANPRTDLFNPNIIRSSVGCVFTNNVVTASTEEIIRFLKERKIAIYCAALQASELYSSCDFTKASAIVVGTEADGLSDDWLHRSDQNIMIPMQGEIDSMNVSVAAGILIFEAKRQRGFN